MRIRLQQLVSEYGGVALGIYLGLFLTVLAGSWAAIHLGWRPESATGNVGAFTTAYLVTKLSQPLRIAATLALTPLFARIYRQLQARATRL